MVATGLIGSILFIALLGFGVYLIVTYIKMPEVFRQVIVVAAAIFALFWFLHQVGFVDPPLPKWGR